MSEVNLQVLADFINVFRGNEDGHGVHEYKELTIEGKKEEGSSYTNNTETVTSDMYKEHLQGKKGLGLSPIMRDDSCLFAVLDVDIYESSIINQIVKVIYTFNFPIYPFKSKSGGLHIYIFFTEAIKAKNVRSLCQRFVSLLLLDKKTEIFPKQDTLVSGSIGNWINLPYYDCECGRTGLIGRDYKVLTIQEALYTINARKFDYGDKDIYFNQIPLNDAPPCLQAIYLKGETDKRNQYMFNIARYYKTKYGDDFEKYVVSANDMLRRPLALDELVKTAISSHKRKDYAYTCKEEPLCSLCQHKECMNREYGIDNDDIPEISFEEFIKYESDPPSYEWKVNGKTLKFYSESEIINQARFRELCFRNVHMLPPKMSDRAWTKIINTALTNVIIKVVNEEDDFSPGALFKQYLAEFLNRNPAASKEQVALERVYKDIDRDCFVFMGKSLLHYMIIQKQFRYFQPTEMYTRLRDLGGDSIKYSLGNKGYVRVFILPVSALKKFVNNAAIDDCKVNFLDKEEFKDKDF